MNIVRNGADYAAGFGAQFLDDVSFGLYGQLTHTNWANGSDAFQYGRRAEQAVSTIGGAVEFVVGAYVAATSIQLIPPTAGGAAACGVLSGGVCLPLGGLAIAVETAGVLVGTGMVAHGGAMMARNLGNPISEPEDPTLRYGSNTGDTSHNAQILRQNIEQAGVEAPPGHEAHHIVPSRSSYWSAREARRLLWEKFGIDINAAENGVFVSKSTNTHLNNRKYMDAVYEALQQAQTREQAIEILQDIAEQISLTGNYP